MHKPLLGPLERAAARTAMQIEQAMRQVRADRAEYLRNTDNPMPFSEAIAVGAEQATDNSNGTPSGADRVVNPVVLVLDNLRSAHNVGSIFRSADTAGAAGVVTCG